jgi:hypothetical protein
METRVARSKDTEQTMSVITRMWPLLPAFVIAFGAIIVAAGGFWAAWRQSDFNVELRDKNEEIARLKRENASAITGGDGFCWMAFQVVSSNGELVNANSIPDELVLVPNFIHQGNYPLYDVSARIIDIDALPRNIAQATTKAIIGNMTPGFAATTPARITLHGKGRWMGFGEHVTVGLGGGKELLREVSANYPRAANGEVDWMKGCRRELSLSNTAHAEGARKVPVPWRDTLARWMTRPRPSLAN